MSCRGSIWLLAVPLLEDHFEIIHSVGRSLSNPLQYFLTPRCSLLLQDKLWVDWSHSSKMCCKLLWISVGFRGNKWLLAVSQSVTLDHMIYSEWLKGTHGLAVDLLIVCTTVGTWRVGLTVGTSRTIIGSYFPCHVVDYSKCLTKHKILYATPLPLVDVRDTQTSDDWGWCCVPNATLFPI